MSKEGLQIHQQHLRHLGQLNIIFKLGRMKIYLNTFNESGKLISTIMVFTDYGQLGTLWRPFPHSVSTYIRRRNKRSDLILTAMDSSGEPADA